MNFLALEIKQSQYIRKLPKERYIVVVVWSSVSGENFGRRRSTTHRLPWRFVVISVNLILRILGNLEPLFTSRQILSVLGTCFSQCSIPFWRILSPKNIPWKRVFYLSEFDRFWRILFYYMNRSPLDVNHNSRYLWIQNKQTLWQWLDLTSYAVLWRSPVFGPFYIGCIQKVMGKYVYSMQNMQYVVYFFVDVVRFPLYIIQKMHIRRSSMVKTSPTYTHPISINKQAVSCPNNAC